ncbi:NUDIX domain-containing protein [Janibacter sp. YIM B02568]|uniref:NUDIX hydrolase n=1 Tax=Janibacter endophyticus TaxID=2806261 RepID=UPI0019524B6F|nr:NUDIX domain-containing protein [Janibacter endophyticus]MBM6547237.1 NUDIX domain-containing protein [Janibacter endophyticus]
MTTRDFPVVHDRGLLDEPETIAPLRPASTVMLVRDGIGGLEVFVLRRVGTMSFAPSVHVFPGGGVDGRDTSDDLPWAGPSVTEWSEVMDCPEDEVRGFVAAAAREVFEETGVLLAGAEDGSDPVERLGGREAAARSRQALVERELSFAEVLRDAGLRLRSDLLTYRAHWITPVTEPWRFDTRFFLAEVPAGQEPDGETSEADHAAWVRPEELLAAGDSGDALVMPPTRVCLEQLAAAGSVARAMAERPPTSAILPVFVNTPDGPVVRVELP